MRKLALTYLFICVSLFATRQCFATQVTLTGAGSPGGAGGGFQGAGDIVSGASIYYNADGCYSFAYTGNVVGLVDTATGGGAGGSATLLACSGGVVSAVTSSTLCTFRASGTACAPLATTCGTSGSPISCSVAKLYDQSGANSCTGAACDAVNANVMPTWVYNSIGSQACMQFVTATGNALAGVNWNTAIASPTIYTVLGVGERTGNTGAINGLWSINLMHMRWPASPTTNTIELSTNNAGQAPATDSVPHVFQAVVNSPGFTNTSTFQVDNVVTSGLDMGTAGPSTSANIFIGNDNGGNYMTGIVCEVGLWPTDFAGLSKLTPMYNNIKARYPGSGFP